MGILKDIYRVVTKLKRRKLGKLTPKLCPRCGSPKLRFSGGFDTYPRMYGLTPGQYACEDCGYKGPIALELEEENH